MKRKRIKHVPEEVIAEILLSNLPIKSLLRFKSVSKSWRSLISSPKFVQDHLNRSKSDHTLIATFSDEETDVTLSLRSCSLNSLLDEPNQKDVVSTWEHHYPTTANIDFPIRIMGSCNGLILIKSGRCGLFLWNPSTRKVKTIPSPLSRPTQLGARDKLTYGFGYDDSTHDYKVVFLMRCCIPGPTITYETKIYSARTGSWKKIDNFGGQIGSNDPWKFVNGKLHQLAYKDREWCIVSLSLREGEEKYQVLPLPKNFYIGSFQRLEILGDYLSLIHGDHYLNYYRGFWVVDVWVMMTYGMEESWTKICTLPDFYHDLALPSGVSAMPFWVTENGDIFVFFGKSKVIVYNGKNKLREYQIGEANLPGDINNIVYVESLVLP